MTKRHYGKIKSTGEIAIVVSPDLKDGNCLIINDDVLPNRIKPILNRFMVSPEAQQASNLLEALGTRMVETGQTLLQTLHYAGLMKAHPVDDIVLTPADGLVIELRDVVDELNNLEQRKEPKQENTTPVHQTNVNLVTSTNEEREKMMYENLHEVLFLLDDVNRKVGISVDAGESLDKKEGYITNQAVKDILEKVKTLSSTLSEKLGEVDKHLADSKPKKAKPTTK